MKRNFLKKYSFKKLYSLGLQTQDFGRNPFKKRFYFKTYLLSKLYRVIIIDIHDLDLKYYRNNTLETTSIGTSGKKMLIKFCVQLFFKSIVGIVFSDV